MCRLKQLAPLRPYNLLTVVFLFTSLSHAQTKQPQAQSLQIFSQTAKTLLNPENPALLEARKKMNKNGLLQGQKNLDAMNVISGSSGQLSTKTKDELIKLRTDGGMDSGGGNVCWIGGRPYLLELTNDLASLNRPGLQINIAALEKARAQRRFRLPIKYHLLNEEMLTFIRSKLAKFEKTSPGFGDLLEQIITLQPTILVNGKLSTPVYADTSSYPNCAGQKITASALTNMFNTKIVDAAIWNQMDFVSQAGLLIHEALRTIQISLSQTAGSQALMSDAELQTLTATILSNRPAPQIYNRPFIQALLFDRYMVPENALADLCNSVNASRSHLNFSQQTNNVIESVCRSSSRGSAQVTITISILLIDSLAKDLSQPQSMNAGELRSLRSQVAKEQEKIGTMIQQTFYKSPTSIAAAIRPQIMIEAMAFSFLNAYEKMDEFEAMFQRRDRALDRHALQLVDDAVAILTQIYETLALELTYSRKK